MKNERYYQKENNQFNIKNQINNNNYQNKKNNNEYKIRAIINLINDLNLNDLIQIRTEIYHKLKN